MNKIVKFIGSIVLITLILFAAASCPNPANNNDDRTKDSSDNNDDKTKDSSDNNDETIDPDKSSGQQAVVTSVTISPNTVTVTPGTTQQFSVTVAGTNSPAQTVTWTVEGSESTSSINSSGLLSVASDESALVLSVRATSTVDKSKGGNATIKTVEAVNWEVHDLATLADAFYGIVNGEDRKLHIITFIADVAIPPSPALIYTFDGPSNLTVIIQGSFTITISEKGYMLNIGDNNLFSKQTVIVRDLTLKGREDNTAELVNVVSGSTFRMEGSAKITGNSRGGVHIGNGNLVMQDNAEVSGNTRNDWGAGVSIISGNFLMRDNAKVVYNNSINRGGGVYFYGGTFTMEGGSISNNKVTASDLLTNASGGGVYIDDSSAFNMQGGTISNNTVESGRGGAWGGGVRGNFTMGNGTISGNKVTAINTTSINATIEARGGGVCGNLTMNGGSISGNTVTAGSTSGSSNTVSASGGGVYGKFTMNSGTISGNTASASNNIQAERAYTYGGGVYTPIAYTFTKSGGTIYGNNESEGLRNIATGGPGHAAYHRISLDSPIWRNATAGPSINSDRIDFWLNE